MESRIDIDLVRLKYGAKNKDDLVQFLHVTKPCPTVHTCTKSQLVVRAVEAEIRQHLAFSLSGSEIDRFVVHNCRSDQALHWANRRREGCIQELEKFGYSRVHTRSLKLWELVNKIVRIEKEATATAISTAEACAIPTRPNTTLRSSRWAPFTHPTQVSEAPQQPTITPRPQLTSRSPLPVQLEQAARSPPTSLSPALAVASTLPTPPTPTAPSVPSISLLSPFSPRAETIPSITDDSERRRVEAIYEIRSGPSIHSETSTYKSDLSELSSSTNFVSPPASIASSHSSATLTSISDFAPFFGEELFLTAPFEFLCELPATEFVARSQPHPMICELVDLNSGQAQAAARSSPEMVGVEGIPVLNQSHDTLRTPTAESELSPISPPTPLAHDRPAQNPSNVRSQISYPIVPQPKSAARTSETSSASFCDYSDTMVNELEQLVNDRRSGCQRSQVGHSSSSVQGLAHSRWAKVSTQSARRPAASRLWPSYGIVPPERPCFPSSSESHQVQSEPIVRSGDRQQPANLGSTRTWIIGNGEASNGDVAGSAPRMSRMTRKTWAEIRAGHC